MFTLPYIIAHLYPDKPEAELQALVDRCVNEAKEYYPETWRAVFPADLTNPLVQLSLAKTIFRAQSGPWGIENIILQALEDWGDGAVIFRNLPSADNAFYQRAYCYMGFLNFAYDKFSTQMFLLDTRFLLMACVADIPLYAQVQDYFARFQYVKGSQEDANLFAGAIARNVTLFGEEGKIHKPIAEWIKVFDNFFGSSIENRIPEFMENSVEVSRLSPENKTYLERIITLYWGLKGGFIWREIDYVNDGGFEPATTKDAKTLQDYYLDVLNEADENSLTQWLEDYKTVAEWIVATGQSEVFVTQLFKTLAKKVNLQNPEQINLVMEFAHALKDQGLENVDEVLFYNEKDQQFHWDKELLT